MSRMRDEADLLGSSADYIVGRIRFPADGLIPVITQEAGSGRVLMLAWMDEAAVRASIDTRRGTYFSRSRCRQWIKGETSGNTQTVVGLQWDCDGDALLMTVEQSGPACHTGAHSCFDTGGGQ